MKQQGAGFSCPFLRIFRNLRQQTFKPYSSDTPMTIHSLATWSPTTWSEQQLGRLLLALTAVALVLAVGCVLLLTI